MGIRALALLAVVGMLITGCGNGNSDARSREERVISSLPAAPPDSIEELTLGSPGAIGPPRGVAESDFPTGTAVLRGPHFGLGIAWVASGPGVVTDHDPFLSPLTGRRAASGQELVLVSFDPQVHGGQWKPSDPPNDPLAEVVVDGRPHALSKVLMNVPKFPLPPDHTVLLVLSVRKDAPIELRVKDADRTQTINVRTGTRAADAIPGYYRPTTQTLDIDRPIPAGMIVRGVPYPLNLKITGRSLADMYEPFAVLAPWTPEQGWATPGRAWLVLPSPILDGDIASKAPLVKLTVDESKVFHVRLPDGTLVPELGGTRTMTSSDSFLNASHPDLVFAVPDSFTTGSYLIDLSKAPPVAEFSDGNLPARWQPAPPVVEVPLNLNG